MPLGLTAAASVTDGANSQKQKNSHGSGMTTLIISSRKMRNIMKKVKALKDLGLLIKDVSKTIENKTKKR